MDQTVRQRIESALAKPLPDDAESIDTEAFDPWSDVIDGIHGSYSSESDALMIAALEAVRDHSTFEFIDRFRFAAEFALYVLSGHGYTEYGTSPRGAWADPAIEDLWQPLIDKWKAYAEIAWGEAPSLQDSEV